jgi:hypothetical protein
VERTLRGRRDIEVVDEYVVPTKVVKWRWPRAGAYVWLAFVALVVATAFGPAPPLVPIGLAAALGITYAIAYGPWSWKQWPGWLRVTGPVRRVVGWYGYGQTRAELVLRPRLVFRLILWPLLPWSMYCRVELRSGTLTSFGNPRQDSPVLIDGSTSIHLARDQGFALPDRNIYRILTVTHPLGGRIRLSVTVWSHWRRLAQIVDPGNRLGLELTGWTTDEG